MHPFNHFAADVSFLFYFLPVPHNAIWNTTIVIILFLFKILFLFYLFIYLCIFMRLIFFSIR